MVKNKGCGKYMFEDEYVIRSSFTETFLEFESDLFWKANKITPNLSKISLDYILSIPRRLGQSEVTQTLLNILVPVKHQQSKQ